MLADAMFCLPEVISKVRQGDPDPRHMSTSFVERQNLTMRMSIRRMTRLTNAFSKKLDNLKAACALHFAYYNFCRIYQTLRVTPAMEAGLTDHAWKLEELLCSWDVKIIPHHGIYNTAFLRLAIQTQPQFVVYATNRGWYCWVKLSGKPINLVSAFSILPVAIA
jgi:hypothetical protein